MSQSEASVVRSGGLLQGFGGGQPVNSVRTAREMSRICDVQRLARCAGPEGRDAHGLAWYSATRPCWQRSAWRGDGWRGDVVERCDEPAIESPNPMNESPNPEWRGELTAESAAILPIPPCTMYPPCAALPSILPLPPCAALPSSVEPVCTPTRQSICSLISLICLRLHARGGLGAISPCAWSRTPRVQGGSPSP